MSEDISKQRLDEAFGRLPDKQYVVPVQERNVLLIKWARTGTGFGELALVVGPLGLSIDSEHMGPAFVKEVLGALVDEAFAAGRAS